MCAHPCAQWQCVTPFPPGSCRLAAEVAAHCPAPSVPSFDDVAGEKLPFLNCVINEALRLYPPAPIISRDVVEEFSAGGYVFPRGSSVIVSIQGLHTSAAYWDDPFTFNPDR